MTHLTPRPSDILIIGDEWSTLDHPRDSSIYLASFVTKEYGNRVFWAEQQNVFLEGTEAWVDLSGEIINEQLVTSGISFHPRPFSGFPSIHWRPAPPVELQTMRLWSWLSELANRLPPIFNSPQALLSWN